MSHHPDALAIVSTFVLGGMEPMRLVIHHDDGSWSFLCNTTASPDHLVAAHPAEVFARFGSDLAPLRSMAKGHLAERQEAGDAWCTEPYVEE